MKKCSNPEHPHCTFWVLPGESVCAAKHPQATIAPSSYDLLTALRSARSEPSATAPPHAPAADTVIAPATIALPATAPAVSAPMAQAAMPARAPTSTAAAVPALPGRPAYQPVQAHLHISGFDPRAAGGRQTLKMELRGMGAACAPQLTLRLRSDLIPRGAVQHDFVRTTRGDWRPVFVEFSSRNKEHGQYQIEVEVHSHVDGAVAQKWVCTFVILVPRCDATLTEIHQIFLSTHKNVRVMADDASIARVTGGDGCNLDVTARNAGIAHVDLSAPQGKIDMGFTTIAWDEELIEVDLPAASHCHPHPSHAACLVNAAPEAGEQRQIRLFALEECLLGRFELVDPEADVLLSHFSPDGQDNNGLTRRLSGRHAIIRRSAQGFEIEDVSRYGLLLDGVWPGKHKPVALRLGMRIELSASIKGIVVLSVTALLAHGVILHRIDHGARAECFYLLLPEARPAPAGHAATPQAAALPVLFHRNGGFWHLDAASGKETALAPATSLDKLSGFARHNRFASDPYPECWIIRTEGAALCDSGVLTA
ncbi:MULTISPECIES: FHA domain-containing protein [unclassified Janthinobacterium]|uniref:FHA domain-containing protein n=1 Tax=unclassified Janthinobacterium TaxID=2610881 RepID=UPI0020C86DC4|nr:MULTISPECIES: FHA domain-containing protein [unclassified Janthinobacterium]